MALTKISVGMENGVPAIEENFETLDAVTRTCSTTVTVPVSAIAKSGTLILNRDGKNVNARLNWSSASAAQWKPLVTVPVGYQPTSDGTGTVAMSTSNGGYYVGVYYSGGALNVMFGDASQGTAAYTANWSWVTADEFPA